MESVVKKIAEQAKNKYYGKYRGLVSDNIDPQKLGRLKLQIPSLLGEVVSGWALPCIPYGGLHDQGMFMVPEVDAQVWVEFEAGELNMPIWTGTFWRPDEIPEEAAKDEPTTRLLKTNSGHRLQFDDAPGEEKIILHHSESSEVLMDENGSISLTDSNGSQVMLDARNSEIKIQDSQGNHLTMSSSGLVVEDSNGNTISMDSGGIAVEGTQVVIKGSQISLGGTGGEPLIKGQSFLTLFATHMHTTTAPGTPTSPPIPQGEMSTLSTKVTCS